MQVIGPMKESGFCAYAVYNISYTFIKKTNFIKRFYLIYLNNVSVK